VNAADSEAHQATRDNSIFRTDLFQPHCNIDLIVTMQQKIPIYNNMNDTNTWGMYDEECPVGYG